jgi:hypothetical protein
VFGWHFTTDEWLGIVGILVPVSGLLYAYYRASNRAKYEVVGRFINEGVV